MSTHPIGNTSLTTFAVPAEIKLRAKAHGLNISHVCREAIRQRVELMDWIAKRDKSYTATLAPLEVDDIVFPDDCSGVDVE